MRAPEILAGSISSLAAHPLRSLLTVLGVVTGVAAVIVVVAVGEGSRRMVISQLELLGSRLLVVLPGSASGSGGGLDSLSIADADAIEDAIPGAKTSPEVLGKAVAKRGRITVTVPVAGAVPSFVAVRNFRFQSGRFLSPGENRGRARVAVIGPRTADRLFPQGQAVGQDMSLDDSRYHVIGVFEAKGDLGWFHPDELVVIPLATAQNRLLGISHLHSIAVQSPEGADMESVSARLVDLLRRRHKQNPALDKAGLDFHIISQREMIETMAKVSRTLTLLLVSIAAVALITGGVGIMNIMLVSVTERTAEIGIRKAVGATGADIFLQFLAESVMLSGAGALLGVLAGAGIAHLLSGYGRWELMVSVGGVLMAVGMAVLVGLVFGIYPAVRAAALEPVEALRG